MLLYRLLLRLYPAWFRAECVKLRCKRCRQSSLVTRKLLGRLDVVKWLSENFLRATGRFVVGKQQKCYRAGCK